MLKKIIIVFVLLTINPLSIKAENIEKIYTENYYIESENPKEYPNKDNEKFIIKEYRSEIKLEAKPNRIEDEKIEYGYNELLIKYIIINSFKLENDIYLSEIIITNKKENKKVNYQLECTSCEENLKEYLKDEVINENQETIKKGLTLTIELEKEYNPKNLEIEALIKNKDNSANTIGYEIWYLDFKPEIVKYTSKYNNGIAHKSEIVTINNGMEHQKVKTNINEENIKNKRYSEKIIYLEEKQENSFYDYIEERRYYLYQDKLFKYYKTKRQEKNNEEVKIKTNKKIKNKEKEKIKKKNLITNQELKIEKQNKIKLEQVNKKTNQENKKTEEKNLIQKKEIILSYNKITKQTKNNKVPHIILVILLVLLAIMLKTIRSLKKEQ